MAIGIFTVASPLQKDRVEFVFSVGERIKKFAENWGGFVKLSPIITTNADAAKQAEEFAGKIDGAIIVVLSGGTDRMIYYIASRLGVPTLVFAQQYHNSLASVREAIAALRYEGRDVIVEYARLEDLEEVLAPYIDAHKAISELKGSRIGLVGKPEPWLLIRREPELVKTRFGVEVVDIPWEEMLETAKKADSSDVARVMSRLKSEFGNIEVSDERLENAVRLYLAMKSLAEKYGLSAMAVEARDMLDESLREWGPYLGVALLSDDGIPTDYEVDHDGILTKLILHRLTGEQGFMANLTRIMENRVIFSHCTIPTKMIDVRSSTLMTYYETERSVAIRGALKEGAIMTFARFGGPRLDKVMVGKGRVVRGLIGDPNLCRTQVELEVYGNPYTLVEKSLGNHTILVYGDHVKKIEYFAKLGGIEVIKV
ncbi:MAG: hypothetical protein F7C07_02335 [Desulfurococcales archaeon]|nr:hypothetical protein [Desulfurococcales archaeon]